MSLRISIPYWLALLSLVVAIVINYWTPEWAKQVTPILLAVATFCVAWAGVLFQDKVYKVQATALALQKDIAKIQQNA